MITDVTGIELISGNFGKDCPGNGKHKDENGIYIELCCDECDYLQCCISKNPHCESCNDKKCKRSQKSTDKTGFSF